MNAFFEGLLAGFGIAIPVGAIAVLIMDTTLRRGFYAGFSAGAGAATADFVYAVLAAVAGSILATWLEPHADSIRLVSGTVLVGLGVVGIVRSFRTVVGERRTQGEGGYRKLYVQFLALTLINPMTVVYFSALIMGGTVGFVSTLTERVMFVAGAGLASFSWQSFLAAAGAVLRQRLSSRTQLSLSILGNLVVIGLGLRIFLGR